MPNSPFPRPINLERVVFVDQVPLTGFQHGHGGGGGVETTLLDDSELHVLKTIFPSPQNQDLMTTTTTTATATTTTTTILPSDEAVVVSTKPTAAMDYSALLKDAGQGRDVVNSYSASNGVLRELFGSTNFALQCLFQLRPAADILSTTGAIASAAAAPAAEDDDDDDDDDDMADAPHTLTPSTFANITSDQIFQPTRMTEHHQDDNNADCDLSSTASSCGDEDEDEEDTPTTLIDPQTELTTSSNEYHSMRPSFDTSPTTLLTTSSSPQQERQNSGGTAAAAGKKRRFRALKSGQWFEKYQELVKYKDEHGDCNVPLNNPGTQYESLAKWVKRQRYQYNLSLHGKHSNLTKERQTALEELGFVWSCHGAKWEDRFEELFAFYEEYGHCNVPRGYDKNRQLANWVKCQRRHYRWIMKGKGPSNNTLNTKRITMLESIGFSWERRGEHGV